VRTVGLSARLVRRVFEVAEDDAAALDHPPTIIHG
jgi:ATP-dependent 26S proteasome regulatory subunit